MIDPFLSPWLYLLLVAISVALGWRRAAACVLSGTLAYASAWAVQSLSHSSFPSISVSIIVAMGFWLTSSFSWKLQPLISFAVLVAFVSIQRTVLGRHHVIDIAGGLLMAGICVLVARRILIRDAARLCDADDLAAAWPTRTYVPSGCRYSWSRAEVVERYPDPVTPLFADLFLSALGRSVQTMTRSLAINRSRVTIGYCVRNAYIFSNMSFRSLKPWRMARHLFGMRRGFLTYALSEYTEATKRFWREYASLNSRCSQAVVLSDRYLLLLQCHDLFERWMQQQVKSLFYVTFGLFYLRIVIMLHFPFSFRVMLKELPLGIPTPSDQEAGSLYRLGRYLRAHKDVSTLRELEGEAWSVATEILQSMGDRAASYDFTEPMWRSNPDLILEVARSIAESEDSPEVRLASLAKQRLLAEDRLRSRLQRLHPVTGRKLGDDTLALVHALYPLKEDRQRQMAAAWALVRQEVLAIGESLSESGGIPDAAQVYFLTASELSAVVYRMIGARDFLPPVKDRDRLSALVSVRRVEFETAKACSPAPEGGRDVVLELGRRPRRGAGNADLRAKYSLPGSVRAPAIVIRNQQEFSKMRPGCILVAPVTNPHWDVLFGMAVGIVVERGGPMSHALLKASEYGLPALIGVVNATRKIKDGDYLHLDGDHSTLRIERRANDRQDRHD